MVLSWLLVFTADWVRSTVCAPLHARKWKFAWLLAASVAIVVAPVGVWLERVEALAGGVRVAQRHVLGGRLAAGNEGDRVEPDVATVRLAGRDV
jgi:hypothetical protein